MTKDPTNPSPVVIPWTAARCKRLLRPLACRIANLRTFRELGDGKQPSDASINCKQDGDGWIIERRQNPRKTYGRNTGGGFRAQTCELQLQRRRARELSDMPTQHRPEQGRGHKRSTDSDSDASLPKRTKLDPFVRESPPREVIWSFMSILEQTRVDSRPPGPPSLVSMCLRNLPAYIADEVACRKSEDKDDKSDVDAETYDFLEESFCIVEGKGWPGFKQLVRAKAIHMIKEAIDADLFSWPNIDELRNKCHRNNELDVNRDITKHFLFSGHLPKESKFSSEKHALSLVCHARSSMNPATSILLGCPTFPRWWTDLQLSSLIVSQPFALSSLTCAEIENYLQEIPRRICEKESYSQCASDLAETIFKCISGIDPGATFNKPETALASKTGSLTCLNRLMEVLEEPAIPHFSNREREKVGPRLRQIVVDLASALVQNAFLSRNDEKNQLNQDCITYRLQPIRSASRQVVRSCQHPAWLNNAVKNEWTGPPCAVLIADIIGLLMIVDETSYSEREQLLQNRISCITRLSVRSRKGALPARLVIDDVVSLIIATSECFERAGGEDFVLLKHVVGYLKDFRSGNPVEENLTSRVAMDTVMGYVTPRANHARIKYAESVEKEIIRRGVLTMDSTPNLRQPSQRKRSSRLRWEGDICEWIEATPAAPLENRNAAGHDESPTSRSNSTLPLHPITVSRPKQPIAIDRQGTDMFDRGPHDTRLEYSSERGERTDEDERGRILRSHRQSNHSVEDIDNEDSMDTSQCSESSSDESSPPVFDTEEENSDMDELSLTTPRALKDITNHSMRLGNSQDHKAVG